MKMLKLGFTAQFTTFFGSFNGSFLVYIGTQVRFYFPCSKKHQFGTYKVSTPTLRIMHTVGYILGYGIHAVSGGPAGALIITQLPE